MYSRIQLRDTPSLRGTEEIDCACVGVQSARLQRAGSSLPARGMHNRLKDVRRFRPSHLAKAGAADMRIKTEKTQAAHKARAAMVVPDTPGPKLTGYSLLCAPLPTPFCPNPLARSSLSCPTPVTVAARKFGDRWSSTRTGFLMQVAATCYLQTENDVVDCHVNQASKKRAGKMRLTL